jgi:hypothetical protein
MRLTVKDVIEYNSPCFNCNNSILVKICIVNPEKISLDNRVNMIYSNNILECNLNIKYNSILNLKIDPKRNKFYTSHPQALTKFLSDYRLHLVSYCDGCQTEIHSNDLVFDFNKSIIEPTDIAREILYVNDNDTAYQIVSAKHFDISQLIIKYVNQNKEPFYLKLPFIPLSQFKTKEKFIQKIKTYLLFS